MPKNCVCDVNAQCCYHNKKNPLKKLKESDLDKMNIVLAFLGEHMKKCKKCKKQYFKTMGLATMKVMEHSKLQKR